jgi:hypothetical protein
MKKIKLFSILGLLVGVQIIFAQTELPINKIDLWSDNSSVDGVQGQAFILMHSRKGIRIEYNIHRKKLELWVSPLAGKSPNYIDRNFSNRDDYTKIFDKIEFPELNYKDFIKCDYDAFHSVLHFKNNKLHIVSLYDKSAVVVWMEEPGIVDLKSDKMYMMMKKTPKILQYRHQDRMKIFGFAAQIGDGNGSFIHQKVQDPFRSYYSRAQLSANQALFIGGDDASENVGNQLQELASQDGVKYLMSDNAKIEEAVSTGKITVRNNADLQKIIDLNKRVLLSMKDESGAERAALRYIYYLIWHRDGAMSNAYSAYTGWAWPLEKWTEFELFNPTIDKKDEKTERYFGQLVNGKITKKEEDGPFYGIWSAFTHWTQTGSPKFTDERYLKVLEDNISWWENNYYDTERQLFGRYHYCESPFWGSDGDGFDDATGNPSGRNVSKWKGDTIVKAYDLYMNNIVYASYLMLSAMEKGDKSAEYLSKAKKLESGIRKFYTGTELPSYGDLISTKGKTIAAEAFGMDAADYIWGNSVPFFFVDMSLQPMIVEKLYEDQMAKPKGHFFPDWFSNIAAMDAEWIDEQKMIKGIEYVVPQCVKPGKCLPMPYTVCEIVDVEDCSIYHDVRPQAFSISAMFASIANLGVKRYPFGIAVRGTSYLNSIKKYVYKGSQIDFVYKGEGSKIKEVKINGKSLIGTYQIPENQLLKAGNTIEIITDKAGKNVAVLIGSTIRLESVSGKKYRVEAFGKNVLQFKNINEAIVKNENGEKVSTSMKNASSVNFIEFEGKGIFTIEVK